MKLKSMRLPKKSGGFRYVACPPPLLKAYLRDWVPYLNVVAEIHDRHRVSHGFVPGRSPVTNAKEHIGFQWTLSVDIADFFDKIGYSEGFRVPEWRFKYLEYIPRCSYVYRDRFGLSIDSVEAFGSLGRKYRELGSTCVTQQGMPTSPAIANILMSGADEEIVRIVKNAEYVYPTQRGPVVYTRYADDLTFSANHKCQLANVLQFLPCILASKGLELNERKTEWMCARRGRRIITGVAVDDVNVYPSRKVKRRLRAARHQGNKDQINGLAEWAKLKEPSRDKYIDRVRKLVHDRILNKDRSDEDISRMRASLALMEMR